MTLAEKHFQAAKIPNSSSHEGRYPGVENLKIPHDHIFRAPKG
jgi:hypothetical protein